MSNAIDNREKRCRFKIVIDGHYKSGKTSLLKQYIHQQFHKDSQNEIAKFCLETKEILIDNVSVTLEIWENNSKYFNRERNHHIFLRRCKGVILVYDITKYASFERINSIKKYCLDLEARYSTHPASFPFILVANKCDLKREIDDRLRKYDVVYKTKYDDVRMIIISGFCFCCCSNFIPIDIIHIIQSFYGKIHTFIAQQYAMENNMSFYETSAKSGYNVDNVFTDIAKKVYYLEKQHNPNFLNPQSSVIILDPDEYTEKKDYNVWKVSSIIGLIGIIWIYWKLLIL